MGQRIDSWNQVGTKCGIESAIWFFTRNWFRGIDAWALAYYLYCRGRKRPMQMLVVFRSYQKIDQNGAVSNQLTDIEMGGDCVEGRGWHLLMCDRGGVLYSVHPIVLQRKGSTVHRVTEFLCCRMIWVPPPLPFPCEMAPPSLSFYSLCV